MTRLNPEIPTERVVVERNRLLYGALPVSVAATLVLAATLALVQSEVIPPAVTAGWFVAISLVSLARLLVARSYEPRSGEVESARRFERRFAWGALAGGMAWGAAGLLLFAGDIVHQTFLGFVVAGVSAGAIGGLSVSLRALTAFLVPALLPLAFRLLATGDLVTISMGMMAFLFLGFLIASGRRIGRMLNDNIRLRLTESDREAESRRSRELLERVGRIARIGGWEWDVERNALHWSSEVYRFYGQDPGTEVDFEKAMSAFEPEDRSRLETALDRALTEKEPYDLELRFSGVDPSVRWVRARGQPVVRDHRVVRLTGTLQDVTERKQTEERLRTSLDALQRLHEITASTGRTLADKIDGILRLGQDAFGLPLGIVSRVRGSTYRVEHTASAGTAPAPEPGETYALVGTLCEQVYLRERPMALARVEPHRDIGHPAYVEPPVAAYIGTPIMVSGQPFGTLNFSSPEPRDGPLGDLHLALIRIFAEWIGHEMARLNALGELAETEERNRLILQSVGEGIFGLDREGRTTFINPAAVKLLGFDPDQLLGRYMHDLVHHSRLDGSPYPMEECPTTRTFAEGVSLTVADEVLWTSEQQPVPVEYTTTPVRNGDVLVGAVVSFRDVTERKEYERRLTSTLAMQRAILDAANYSIIATDETGVIRTFSRGSERMLGYTEEEMVGQATPELIHDPEEVEERAEELSDELGRPVEPGFEVFVGLARERNQADERKWTYIRKDGSRLPVLLSVTAVRDSEGTLLGYLGIAADVTEREKVDRLKSEFVSTVSHELRTPLTSIRGSLGLVAGGAAGELPERAEELVRVAARNSERLILLINDILDMEKIESGKIEFSFTPQPILPLVQESLEANEPYARQHDTTYRLAAGVSDDLLVNVDENRLAQALANLFSNAAKFTDPGTDVEIAVSRENEAARIAVTDHGPGIPEEFRSRIFQKFSQADASDRRREGGTGLGLSITRALVERMGGRVWFETETGVGTTFTIQLPVWSPADSSPVRRTRRRVLICSADTETGQAVAEILREGGYEPGVVVSAARARQRLASPERPFTALLLDLSVPETEAVELVQWLRSRPETESLPVIALGARVEGDDLALGAKLPIADWLAKPVDADEVASILTRLSDDVGRPSVLHVEDDADLRDTVAAVAGDLAEFDAAGTLQEARDALDGRPYDLILLDLMLPDGSGWELFPALDALDARPAIVIFSARTVTESDARGVEAVLMKSRTSEDELLATLARLLEKPERATEMTTEPSDQNHG